NETFPGKVTRIAPQGEVEDNITVFKVKIEILGNGKSKLKPMMTANVDIVSHLEKNVLYVPREAVNKEDGELFAVVLEDETPSKVPITTGIQNEIYVRVLSVLQEGETLVVGDWKKIQAEKETSNSKRSTLRKILWMLRSK
ncbi:MAG: efflux transporter periplasmic adaptor subunit, partial [Nitrospinales bacterium]